MWVLQTINHFTGIVFLCKNNDIFQYDWKWIDDGFLNEMSIPTHILRSSDYPESPASASYPVWPDYDPAGDRGPHTAAGTLTPWWIFLHFAQRRGGKIESKTVKLSKRRCWKSKAPLSSENYSSLQGTNAGLVFLSYFLTYFWHSKTLGK